MPQLLQWCTLSPQGESNLAAIRFAAPIRISTIRIFPKDAQPFKELPDAVSKTEPEAFFLELFFNAQDMNPTSEPKDHQRAPNALVPTSLAYAGGQMDFYVDMGTEYATRLMIVKGKYDFVSLAIYGEEVVSKPTPVRSYEQTALPVVDPIPLSKAIDPANSSQPKELAEKLLSIISDSVPLPLVVRLMFCLKASDEDWEDQEFPHLYADLENAEEDFDLKGIVSSVARPVEDGVPAEAYVTLANRVSDFIGPKDNDQAYYIAKLISIAAPQHPDMARTLLENLDLTAIFDETTVDEYVMVYLLQACANRDVAAHISKNAILLDLFETLQASSKVDPIIQASAKRLLDRIQGWSVFEDCLVNSKGDFPNAIKFLKDITLEENSLGIWLSCVLLNSELYNPLVREDTSTWDALPLQLFRNGGTACNHDEFLTFVRALVGVIAVTAAFAFADGLPYELCRERTLAIINIWQSVEGYDTIVNQVMQLRQLTTRLIWIIEDSDPPRRSGIFSERILAKLGENPEINLQDAFIEKILDLNQPLSVISENERLSLRKNAFVAKDGLVAAVEELLFTSQRPFSLRRLRTLRVSVAIVRRELASEEGEWRVLEQFWKDNAHGLLARVVDLLADVAEDIYKHFGLNNTNRMDQPQVAQLFSTANDMLHLIEAVSTGYPLTSRSLQSLSTAVADLLVCCDSADALFTQTSSACVAAQIARQACLDVIHALTGPDVVTEAGCLSAQIVLRALLKHASSPDEHDPVHKLLQVYSLIDHMLPYPNDDDMEADPSHWIVSVLPRSLAELKAFFKVLDLESRLHLFRRLVRLDDEATGIGEWLLGEELKGSIEVLRELERPSLSEDYRLVLQYQLSDSLQFALDLVKPESTLSNWYHSALSNNRDLSRLQTNLLDAILEARYSSSTLSRFVQALTTKSEELYPELRTSILLHILRNTQVDPTLPGNLESFMTTLRSIPSDQLEPGRLRAELGPSVASYSRHSTSLDNETAAIVLQLLEWALHQANKGTQLSTLRGLKADEFQTLCDTLVNLLPGSEAAISDVRSNITIDEDEVFTPETTELPSEPLQLSVGALEGLLDPVDPDQPSRPSTPRAGNKTPDILGTIISPPTALLRSPAATGLTKTYANDDFRQLRQVPSARLNTSRLPSMHGASHRHQEPAPH
ncbi:hypothetical protein D9611_002711 [Ephemerocybe angulata]|uniref:Virilizer N-terminal domain-containing protein n=1 Tax=Ephemerocybe angulata TaxID=980116 RepID=A0A8H5C3A6_9AGAR|nr:hypothetical protein D9611_002711 [Tulosesus angulatus]